MPSFYQENTEQSNEKNDYYESEGFGNENIPTTTASGGEVKVDSGKRYSNEYLVSSIIWSKMTNPKIIGK